MVNSHNSHNCRADISIVGWNFEGIIYFKLYFKIDFGEVRIWTVQSISLQKNIQNFSVKILTVYIKILTPLHDFIPVTNWPQPSVQVHTQFKWVKFERIVMVGVIKLHLLYGVVFANQIDFWLK